MTDYMIDSAKPMLLRGLSLFHGWLPFLLIYLVLRLGYDQRALKAWTVLAWVVMLVAFFMLTGPQANAGLTPVDVNYVYGLSETEPQHWVPHWVWLAAMMIGLPALLFLPTHHFLARIARRGR